MQSQLVSAVLQCEQKGMGGVIYTKEKDNLYLTHKTHNYYEKVEILCSDAGSAADDGFHLQFVYR